MWRVSSPDGRAWVQYDNGRVSAGGLPAGVDVQGDQPVEVLPMTGQWYRPSGDRDPVAVFLRARQVIGDNGLRVTGSPPVLPQSADEEPLPGVVF